MGRGDGALLVAASGGRGHRLVPGGGLFPGDRFIWQGVVLLAYGVFFMGLGDNLLRPLLMGKGTQMPDYLVLISTLVVIAAFGLSGFVIGPVVAALVIAVWDIFSRSRQSAHDEGKEEALSGAWAKIPFFPAFGLAICPLRSPAKKP